MLGSANKPVDSLFALAFQINFDPAIFDTANAQLNINSSWMGKSGVNLSSFKKILTATGQVIMALGRTDRTNIAGNGEIGELVLMTKANIPVQPGNNVILAPEILRGTTVVGKPVTFNTQATQVTVAVTTGINQPDIDQSVSLYPNPTTGNFLLSINQPNKQLTIELLNIQGEQLYVEQLKDVSSLNKNFNFSYLAKGVYLLKVSTENGVVVKRLVMQ